MYWVSGRMMLLFLFPLALLVALLASTGTAHAYVEDGHIVMLKSSDGMPIYVFAGSADTLERRGYADPLDELNEKCGRATDRGMECGIIALNPQRPIPAHCSYETMDLGIQQGCSLIIREWVEGEDDEDLLCVYSPRENNHSSDDDPLECLVTFEVPAYHEDCKRLYKFYAISVASYPLDRLMVVPDTSFQSYFMFSFFLCDVEREYNAYELEYQVAHDADFVANQGLPNTIDCAASGGNDTDPLQIFYHCKFSSERQHFNGEAVMQEGKAGPLFRFAVF